MKKVLWAIALSSLLMLWGFAPENKKETPQLEGVWVMKTEKHGNAAAKEASTETVKKKILTDKHFTWVEYSKDGELLAMGGGSYTIEGDTYTENIEFFFPKGSSLLGASIPFTCKIDGNLWTHTGFLQYRELNSETGLYEVSETDKLEEVWEKVE